MNNILLATDCYKLNHMLMYKPGTTKVYSYLMARSLKNFTHSVFFGLQYYLKEYLNKPITQEMADEFIETYKHILGECPEDVKSKIQSLVKLGYWPIKIKAVPEGTIINNQNVLMTITNTSPDFYWCVGFIESIILKVWYPITVATQCYEYRKVIHDAFQRTSDLPLSVADFYVHDFGYRGDTSEEGAAISGAAHLLSFKGSDTIPAFGFARKYYGASPEGLMASVPASEHSVMCSYGKDNEIEAFRRMLELYPNGIVSIVSDTFNVWKVLTDFVSILKKEILGRNGKTVFRPDSGIPELIICGNPAAEVDSEEYLGCIRLLDKAFGHTINSKGYKVLNDKVGLIYGDGMYLERYKRTLATLEAMGYSAENLVIGVGGILRHHTRDTLGFAIKATYIEVDGVPQEIEKDPITDKGKKSHKGLLQLTENVDGSFITFDRASLEGEELSSLVTVFKDGIIMKEYNFDDIRERVCNYANRI